MGNALLSILAAAAGIPSDGIKSGQRIQRTCVVCNVTYVGWSDDTVTIKGPMRPDGKCPECKQEEFKNIDLSDLEHQIRRNNQIE